VGMRILMVITSFTPLIGGAEIQARLLAKVLVSKGFSVEVLTRRHKSWPKREVIDNFILNRVRGVPFLGVFSEISTGFLFCYFLFKRRKSIDIVHLHQATLLTSFAGFFARVCLNKKVICKIANSGEKFDLITLENRYKILGKFLKYIHILSVDLFISLNHKIYTQLLQENVSAIEIIPNGVKIDSVITKSNITTKRIISTSRLIPQKNIESLIIAFSKLALVYNEVVLCIYGDGPLKNNLVLLAKELNISENRIFFFGNVLDARNIFQYGDIFVLPSFVEGMSNSLLEAMSLGVPCIVSEIQENLEVISNKDRASFFDPNNVEELVDKLLLIINSDSLYDLLSTNSRELAVNNYDISKVADSYVSVYQKISPEIY
jgi:glycosyltransferase involved in cell wall biosynthesis